MLVPLTLVVGVHVEDVVVQYLIVATWLPVSLPVPLIDSALYHPFEPAVWLATSTFTVGLSVSILYNPLQLISLSFPLLSITLPHTFWLSLFAGNVTIVLVSVTSSVGVHVSLYVMQYLIVATPLSLSVPSILIFKDWYQLLLPVS